jgi:hypothetical protein
MEFRTPRERVTVFAGDEIKSLKARLLSEATEIDKVKEENISNSTTISILRI